VGRSNWLTKKIKKDYIVFVMKKENEVFKLSVGQAVIMPEPEYAWQDWDFGGFLAEVVEVDFDGSVWSAKVVDADGNEYRLNHASVLNCEVVDLEKEQQK
jgi:hypothetical protein